MTPEFHSESSEGMIVLCRKALVYVSFKLNEEETGTGCFLLNTPAVKFWWVFFLLGNAFVYKEVFPFLSLFCFVSHELALFGERFLDRGRSWQIPLQAALASLNSLLTIPGSSSPLMVSS